MELIELINLLPKTNKDLVYKAYKIWFKILYEEYEYNESLVKEFIYDLYNQDICNVIELKRHVNKDIEAAYRTFKKDEDIIFKWKTSSTSYMRAEFMDKLNDFINEY